jgi:hypothetical protein
MSNFGDIILNAGIAIEKSVSPAPDEDAGEEKGNHGESECDAQRRKATLFNHRYHKGATHFHSESVSMPSIDSTMRPEDFPMLRKEGLLLPLRR